MDGRWPTRRSAWHVRCVGCITTWALCVVAPITASPAQASAASAHPTAGISVTSASEKPQTGIVQAGSPLAAAAQRRQGTTAVRFSPTSFFTTPIDTAPLDPKSPFYVAHLVPQVSKVYGGVAAFNAYQYNASFYDVPAAQPRITVNFWNCQKKKSVPSGLFTGPGHFLGVPVPDDAVPAVGTDGEMTIYDAAADQLWEFWKMRRNPTTRQWEACWGGRLDNVSQSQGVFPGMFGATATGIVMAGGMITQEEVRAGEINHAMYLGIREPAHWKKVSWPAARSDGHSQHPYALWEGQRLRLDPRLDVTTLGLTRVGMMVARAAQKYGFVVSDKAGAVAVITESGAAAQARTGVNPWPSLLGMPSYAVMKNFPWHKMQVLPTDYGKPAAR